MKSFNEYLTEGIVSKAVKALVKKGKVPAESEGELVNLVNSELNNPKKVSDKEILDLAYGASMLDEDFVAEAKVKETKNIKEFKSKLFDALTTLMWEEEEIGNDHFVGKMNDYIDNITEDVVEKYKYFKKY